MENRDRDERLDTQGQGGREPTGQNPGKGQGGRNQGMPGQEESTRRSGRTGEREDEQDGVKTGTSGNPSGDRTGQTPRTG